MGLGSARIFERGDTSGLIGCDSGREPGVDIGHAKNAIRRIFRRIKEGIKHATRRPKLQLEARSFTDLERGMAEMLHQLLR